MKEHMGQVRGLALELRGIGKTYFFNERTASFETLSMIPTALGVEGWEEGDKNGKKRKDNNCCRYPCANCRAILPLFDIQAAQNGRQTAPYDKDMIEADVSAW